MRKVFRLKVILITLACVVGVAILLPAAYMLFIIGVGIGLGDNPGWMPPATYSGSAPPQWTPDDSEIVFAHGGSIFAAMSDGSSLRLIHGEDGENDLHYSPALSPDGSTLAYQKLTNDGFYSLFMDNSGWEVATSRLDGSRERVLTELTGYDTTLATPSWSPDGQRLMVMFRREVLSMALDGSGLYPIMVYGKSYPSHGHVSARSTEMPLSRSPDGRRIGFIGEGPAAVGNDPLAGYTLGDDPVGLQKVWDWGTTPVWSPSGNRLAFAEFAWDYEDTVYYATQLYTTDHDGSNPRRVVSLPRGVQWDRLVEWSPSGEELLFGPFVASVDGSVLRILPRPEIGYKPSTGRVIGPSPNEYSLTSWSKDGSRIAILTEYHSVLYTVARDGTDSRVLVEKDEYGNLVAAGGRPLSEGQTVQIIHPDN